MKPHTAKNLAYKLILASLTFAFILILTSAGYARPPKSEGPPFPFPGGKRGQEAITALQERLPEVASRYGKSAKKLEQIFLQDNDLWLDPAEKLLYLCSFGESEAESLPESGESPIPTGPFPLDKTFQLHSMASASKVIYLDFDGHVTSGTYWNSGFNNGADIVSEPYNFEGSTSSFSDAELSRIQKIWARVTEDFAIYDIDVTTEDPGIEALRRSGSGDDAYGIRVVISPSSGWYGNAGGVAYIGSFDWNSDTPTFVFSNLLGNGNEKYVTDATSHETGHTLGLSHDGTTSGTSYYAGHGSWAPIMGVGYYKAITQWSKGEYTGANNTEDDLAVMLNNGASYRLDDHGDWINNASMLSGDILDASGIIERTGDMDVFGFQTEAGDISINVDPANLDPNLDIFVQILDDGGNIINQDDPYYILPASLNLNLPAGTYYILIDGTGTGDPNTGFSDYASLGQYFISGTIATTQFTPDVPTGLSAVPASSSQINLSWTDNSANENGFSIERSPNGLGSWVEVGFTPANTSTYADSGLSMNTTYYYRVSAYNVIGNSDYSNSANATTFDLPPSAASNLNATPVSASRIDLHWTDNSNNETGFAIERSPNGANSWTETATVADNTTMYSDTGLTSGSSFFYRVAAYNINGNSVFSNVADATTQAVPPEGPTNLAATAVSSGQINLAWTDNSDNEDGFKVERSANGISGWTQVGVLGANAGTYSDSNLNPETTYFYRVYAYNSAGSSGFSNTANATTQAVPPDGPTNLAATALSSGQINLAWTDNGNNEDGFKVERSANGISGWTEIGTQGANVTTFIDSGLNSATTYFYRVYTYNSAGSSGFSNTANATTQAVPPEDPTNLAATALSSGQINLAWTDNSDNEDGFKVERSADGINGWTEIVTQGANVTTFIDSGLNSATTYFYRVYAYNNAGSSGFSNTANATTQAVPPEGPTNLAATALSSGQINLAWTDNSDNEDGFKVERSANGISVWTEIGAIASNISVYTDSSVSPGTTYYYRIFSYNSAGASGYSNTAVATTDEPLHFIDQTATQEAAIAGTLSGSFVDTLSSDSAVEMLTEQTSGGRPRNRYTYLEHKWMVQVEPGASITLFANVWAPVSAEGDTFVFSYSTDNENYSDMFTVGADHDDDSYHAYLLPENLSGTVYIRVTDTLREAGSYDRGTLYLDHLFIRTDNEPGVLPLDPTDLTSTGTTFDSISLSWTDNADNELGFFIERSPDGITGWEHVGSTGPDAVAFTDSGLTPGKTFYYQVQAFNSSGASGFTGFASATTAQADSMSVGSMIPWAEMNRNRWDAFVTITVFDQNQNPIAGATVEGSWNDGSSSSAVTDATGQCTLSNTKLKTSVASTSFSVTGVAKNGYIYDPIINAPDTILVSRP